MADLAKTQVKTGKIKIYEKNPAYWEYDGKPLFLYGGSKRDNLFVIDDLKEHLNQLKLVGGNYVRCTIYGDENKGLMPYKADSGLYDLALFDERFWKRFEEFLVLTIERDIIVQIEIWAAKSFYKENWQNNPFNPKKKSD
ncbi:MAG: hypothetical protein ABIA63_01095, partial [bacterium]